MNFNRIATVVFSAFVLLHFNARPSLCSPNISEVRGDYFSGEQLTINGSGFGYGPQIMIFDDFERGQDGQVVTLNANKGSWSGTSINPPLYKADNSENIAALLVDGSLSRQLQFDFDPSQEIFLSYQVRIPSGYHFPNTAVPETFAPDSAWKMSWIMDGSLGYLGDDDICLPTWPNGTYFMLAGNDNAFQLPTGRPGTNSNWFSFEGWNRFSVYLKGGSPDPVDNQGIVWAQGLSQEFGMHVFSATPFIFDGDDNERDNNISQWTRLNISGWHRTAGINAAYDDMTRALYDDIYFATGPNARARVEIGNAAVYDECTQLELLIPESWNPTRITVGTRHTTLPEDQHYLFVIDANGEASEGYLLASQAGSLPTPSGLQATPRP